MSSLTVFDFNSSQVRTLVINNEPWFIAKDVCNLLEIVNVSQALQALDADEKLIYSLHISGQNRDTALLSESGLYTLAIRSNKPQAKPFRKWVTSDVLPSIRKTGKYDSQPHFDIPATLSAALLLASKQAETIELQQQKIALDAPYTAMGQLLEQADGELTITEYAKVIGMGRNKLFDLLRDKGILSKEWNRKNEPYQKYLDAGYFRCVEKETSVGLVLVSLVTPKGQLWLQKQLSNVLVLRTAN